MTNNEKKSVIDTHTLYLHWVAAGGAKSIPVVLMNT